MPKLKPKWISFYGLLICIIAAFFYCYEFVLRIVPGILQTELSARFGHLSAATFGEIAALYYFAYSPMQIPVGMLMDRFGPRRLLTIACAFCALGSYLFAFSHFLPWVALGRFMVGFGSSFAFVGVLTLSTMWLPKELFLLFAGLMTSLSMFANVYAEMKITTMAASVGMDTVLMGTVLLGCILTLIINQVVRDNKNYMQQHATTWTSFLIEVKEVLCSSKVWLVGAIGACLYTSLSVFGELWGQTYLEQAHHLSKIQSAHCMSFLFIGWGIGAPLTGFLSDKLGSRIKPLMIGATGAGFSIFSILFVEHLSFFNLNLLIFLYGIFSSSEIIVFAMAKEISGARITGTVFAVTNMIVSLVGALFQPLVGWLLDTFGHPIYVMDHYQYQIYDYQKALIILPISLSLVMFFCVFVGQLKPTK